MQIGELYFPVATTQKWTAFALPTNEVRIA